MYLLLTRCVPAELPLCCSTAMLRSLLQLVANVATWLCAAQGCACPPGYSCRRCLSVPSSAALPALASTGSSSTLPASRRSLRRSNRCSLSTYSALPQAPVTSACSAQTCGRARLHRGCCARLKRSTAAGKGRPLVPTYSEDRANSALGPISRRCHRPWPAGFVCVARRDSRTGRNFPLGHLPRRSGRGGPRHRQRPQRIARPQRSGRNVSAHPAVRSAVHTLKARSKQYFRFS